MIDSDRKDYRTRNNTRVCSCALEIDAVINKRSESGFHVSVLVSQSLEAIPSILENSFKAI